MAASPPNASSRDYAAAGGYPIGMVVTLTGLPTDVIRAWERRYGVPRPARSAGGHRLYSPADVALLRRAAALRARGLTAAAACAQSLAEAIPPLTSGSSESQASAVTARLSARLHDAALALDAGSVGAALAEAGALVEVETLWGEVIAPVLTLLGGEWAGGVMTPAPEHLLSNMVRGRLLAALEARPRLAGQTEVVVGAGPDEPHDLAALMLGLLLARQAWNVTFLGAATPPEAWAQATEAVRPRVVVISATLTRHAATALVALRAVRDRAGRHAPLLAYGGPAFASEPSGDGVPEQPKQESLLYLPCDVEAAARRLLALA